MRVFKYWVASDFRSDWNGKTFCGRCHGGSNLSENAARQDAVRCWTQVMANIRGERGGHNTPAYTADIREELIHEIDANNLVTRNRYGAEVLNSTDHLFIDIDSPPWCFRDLFGLDRKIEARQRRIVEHVKTVITEPEFAGAACGFTRHLPGFGS
jgi:hypothetical protein